MESRFSSKVDGWLIPIMVLAVGGLFAALIAVLIDGAPWPIRVLLGAVTIIVTMLLFSVFRNTAYVIDGDTLRIVSGPFKWTIPVADINEITPSRNPLSSPALSIDRLKITYSEKKFVLVSPEDKAGFISAIERVKQGSR